MAQGSKIDESSLSMGRLQCEGKIHGRSRGGISSLRIDDGIHCAAWSLLTHLALGRGEPYEGFKQVGGGSGPLNELARAGSHSVDDNLRLIQIADGENRRIRHFLVQQFNRSQSGARIVGRNIDESHVWIGGTYAARDGIGRRQGKGGACVHGAGHTGAVDQHLKDSALLVVSRDDDDGKLWHNLCSLESCEISRRSIFADSLRRYFLLGVSNLPVSINGLGSLGSIGFSVLGEIRRTVHSTISSEWLRCALLLRKKFPKIGVSPRPGILL